MITGEKVEIKTGLWAGTRGTVTAINNCAAYPICIAEENGREHNEKQANVEIINGSGSE